MKKQLNMKVYPETKEAIQSAAIKHKTSMTGLIWRGLLKVEPSLKDVYIKER